MTWTLQDEVNLWINYAIFCPWVFRRPLRLLRRAYARMRRD